MVYLLFIIHIDYLGMKKRYLIVLLFVVLPLPIFSQTVAETEGTMTILDTIVVKKPCQSAVKLNVRISLDHDEPILLPRFYEFVNSDGLYSVIERDGLGDFVGNYGLTYVVVDSNGDFVSTGYSRPFESFVRIEDEERHRNCRWVVRKRSLKARFKWIKDDEKRAEMDKSELRVNGADTVVAVYPIILQKKDSPAASGETLEPGVYRLFLFYSFKKDDIRQRNVFTGYMKSNEIRLIVE